MTAQEQPETIEKKAEEWLKHSIFPNIEPATLVRALLDLLSAERAQRAQIEGEKYWRDGLKKAHDLVARANQDNHHDYAGCTVDGILNIKEGLHEAAKERDAAEASISALKAEIQQIEQEMRDQIAVERGWGDGGCAASIKAFADRLARVGAEK